MTGDAGPFVIEQADASPACGQQMRLSATQSPPGNARSVLIRGANCQLARGQPGSHGASPVHRPDTPVAVVRTQS